MDGITEVAKVFVEPAIKLVDTVARGCGIIYEPTRRKRLAAASAFEISTIADAIRENIDLPITYNNNGIQIDSSDVKELAERATKRMLLQEMRKQQNIEAIVDKAYEELQKETEVTSEPVDDDWLVRFFNSVEDISDDTMRTIWGRILAGEIVKPKSYSARTLDALKNISRNEAELFQTLASYALSWDKTVILLYDVSTHSNYNLRYDRLALLNECRLIDLSAIATLHFRLTNKDVLELESEGLLVQIYSNDTNSDEIWLTQLPLTTTGQEIFNAIYFNVSTNVQGIIELLSKQKYDKEKIQIEAFRITRDKDGRSKANMSENLFEG